MRIYNLLLVFLGLYFALVVAKKSKKEVESTTEIESITESATDDVENEIEVNKKPKKVKNRFPKKAYIAELHYGRKCPEADPKHPYEVDEKITRLDFHTNSVVLEINPTIETHNHTIEYTCSPYFYVKYTKGYRFAITSYEFSGTYHLDKGIRAVLKSENTDAVTHVVEGPIMGTYQFKDELDWSGWKKPNHGKYSEGKLWFGCGTDMIRISVGITSILNNRLNEQGSGTLVLKDFSANIEWDKCPKQKKKYVPTDEDMIKLYSKPPKKTQEEVEKEKEKFAALENEQKAAKSIPEDKIIFKTTKEDSRRS